MEEKSILREHLYKKMTVELDVFTEDFKVLTPQESVDRAFELVTKRELLTCFCSDNENISKEQIMMLVKKRFPLDFLYEEFLKYDDIQDKLIDFIDYSTTREINRQRERPIQDRESR